MGAHDSTEGGPLVLEHPLEHEGAELRSIPWRPANLRELAAFVDSRSGDSLGLPTIDAAMALAVVCTGRPEEIIGKLGLEDFHRLCDRIGIGHALHLRRQAIAKQIRQTCELLGPRKQPPAPPAPDWSRLQKPEKRRLVEEIAPRTNGTALGVAKAVASWCSPEKKVETIRKWIQKQGPSFATELHRLSRADGLESSGT